MNWLARRVRQSAKTAPDILDQRIKGADILYNSFQSSNVKYDDTAKVVGVSSTDALEVGAGSTLACSSIIGAKVKIGKNSRVVLLYVRSSFPMEIVIGDNCNIYGLTVIGEGLGCGVKIGSNSTLGVVKLVVNSSVIKIGSDAYVQDSDIIGYSKSIVVESGATMLAAKLEVLGSLHIGTGFTLASANNNILNDIDVLANLWRSLDNYRRARLLESERTALLYVAGSSGNKQPTVVFGDNVTVSGIWYIYKSKQLLLGDNSRMDTRDVGSVTLYCQELTLGKNASLVVSKDSTLANLLDRGRSQRHYSWNIGNNATLCLPDLARYCYRGPNMVVPDGNKVGINK